MKPFRWIFFTIAVVLILPSVKVSAEIRMTAGYLKKSVDSLALTYVADVKLALVSCYEMDTTGKSSVWSYIFFSADSLKEYHFLAQNNQVSFDRAEEIRVGIGVSIEPWIDSDSALSVAEREGGSDIRKLFPNCGITASLTRPVTPSSHCMWVIEYRLSGSVRTIFVNAANGQIITSVEKTNNRTLPIQFGLRQNYPNPFNPATTIEFTIPQQAYVSLKVFNLIGEEVANLVAKDLFAGNYKIQWDIRNQSSGVYFYRLETAGFTETKKLVILR